MRAHSPLLRAAKRRSPEVKWRLLFWLPHLQHRRRPARPSWVTFCSSPPAPPRGIPPCAIHPPHPGPLAFSSAIQGFTRLVLSLPPSCGSWPPTRQVPKPSSLPSRPSLATSICHARYAHPYSSIPILLSEIEHPNPNLSYRLFVFRSDLIRIVY